MKSNLFRIISSILSILTFGISFVLFLFLDLEGFNSSEVASDRLVSFISGKDALLGGETTIIRGYYSNGAFFNDSSLNFIETFRFDYLTTLGFILCFIFLILMVLFFNRKSLLLIFTICKFLSLIYISFEPYFFNIINSGLNGLETSFNIFGGAFIIPIGMIVFIVFNFVLIIFYLVRVIVLFRNKIAIE